MKQKYEDKKSVQVIRIAGRTSSVVIKHKLEKLRLSENDEIKSSKRILEYNPDFEIKDKNDLLKFIKMNKSWSAEFRGAIVKNN